MRIKELHRRISTAIRAGKKGEIHVCKTLSERNDVLKLKTVFGWDIRTEKRDDGCYRIIAA